MTSESLQMINGKITRIEFWQRDNETSNFFYLNFLKKKLDDKSFFDVEGLSREKKTVNIWNFVFEVEIRFRTRKGQTWEFRFN